VAEGLRAKCLGPPGGPHPEAWPPDLAHSVPGYLKVTGAVWRTPLLAGLRQLPRRVHHAAGLAGEEPRSAYGYLERL